LYDIAVKKKRINLSTSSISITGNTTTKTSSHSLKLRGTMPNTKRYDAEHFCPGGFEFGDAENLIEQ
jgi:hypothetical protein